MTEQRFAGEPEEPGDPLEQQEEDEPKHDDVRLSRVALDRNE